MTIAVPEENSASPFQPLDTAPSFSSLQGQRFLSESPLDFHESHRLLNHDSIGRPPNKPFNPTPIIFAIFYFLITISVIGCVHILRKLYIAMRETERITSIRTTEMVKYHNTDEDQDLPLDSERNLIDTNKKKKP